MKTLLFIQIFITIFCIGIFPQNKRNILWFDATANFERLSYKDSIKYYLDLTKAKGFTDIAVDIKPITGEVLYKSKIAPMMTEWNGFRRDSSFDFLGFFIEEAHRLKLKVHASLNVFVAGHNFFDRGVVYSGRSEWQSINYTDSGFVPITKLKHKYSAMLNPALKEVQEYQLAVIKELAVKYPGLDGLILDRVRYDGIEADFSDSSRTMFEDYAGVKLNMFPADIYEWKKDEGGKLCRVEGKYYKKWLEWRASVIFNFIKEARAAAKEISPSLSFGDYTGAWYPLYYEVGVNWASGTYNAAADYEWATEDYGNYGYAELLDLFTTGNYFFEVTKEEVEQLNEENIKRGEAAMGSGKEYWYSVEGSAEIAGKVVKNAVPIIGGLYVEQYINNPAQFRRAIQMCLDKTAGVMIFDIVHIIKYGWWNEFDLN